MKKLSELQKKFKTDEGAAAKKEYAKFASMSDKELLEKGLSESDIYPLKNWLNTNREYAPKEFIDKQNKIDSFIAEKREKLERLSEEKDSLKLPKYLTADRLKKELSKLGAKVSEYYANTGSYYISLDFQDSDNEKLRDLVEYRISLRDHRKHSNDYVNPDLDILVDIPNNWQDSFAYLVDKLGLKGSFATKVKLYSELDEEMKKVEKSSYEDIANNDRWITVKPHGDEEKGRHLKLEGDETPKEAMKRQWGVDLDKKKDKSSSGSDKPQKDDKKSSDSLKKSQDIKKEIDSLEKELDSFSEKEAEVNRKREKIYQELKEQYKDEPYSYDKEFRIFEETKEKSGANDLMKQKNEIKEKIVEKKKEYRKTIASEYFYPEKIANVSRGPEMSQEKANGGSVNPKYMEHGGYAINCQSCVVCYEARLRGYDVSTKPNTKGSKLNELSREAHAAWIDPETGNYPKILSPETEIKNYKKYYDFLRNSVEEGKRYNFSYLWKGKTRSGHIVSMYKENGDLVLYDPQTGGKYKNDEMINHYLKGIKFSVRSGGFTFNVLPKLYRVDNMAFNPDYVNDIMEAANGR